MAEVISFPGRSTTNNCCIEVQFEPRTSLQRHLDRYQWHFGRDSYWFFVTQKNRLPDKTEALGLAGLLGHRLKANDGKYYGLKSLRRNSQPKAVASELEKIVGIFSEHMKELTALTLRFDDRPNVLFAEQNRDNCEHIANQLQIALSFMIHCMKGTVDVSVSASRRASSPHQGICGT
jgi:hypothetical protein